jgi:transposase
VKNNGISSASSTVWPAAERREAERSEATRSAAAGQTVAPEPPTPSRPDPEVVASAKRRTFTADYKLRILAEADAAAQPGAIGALLRRESLYSSHLVIWRRERQAGILKGLTPHKRGPKSKRNPQEEEMQKLRRENQRLTEELRKAEIVIDVQKKVGALLGWPLPKADSEEKP